jgi:uncharacterized protein (DUF488 family)
VLHTVGYERRDVDELVDLLRGHGITILVDVRGTPRSRKAGLSRTPLAEALAEVGIEYRHERELGVPTEERESFRAGDLATIRRYRARLAGEARPAVERVAASSRDREVALLCFERDEGSCHRRHVAEAVVRLDPSVEHVPLG